MSEENNADFVDETIYGYDIIEINAVLEKRKPICIETHYNYTEKELKEELMRQTTTLLSKESIKNHTQIINNIITAIGNKQLLYIFSII